MNKKNTLKTVMIIDDEEFDQKLYRRTLKHSGLVENVIGFTYAQEALDYLHSPDAEPIDLILLDVNMPRMDGFEFLEAATQQLGSKFTQTPVVMLTTSLAPKDQEQASQYQGVKSYFNKPLIEEDVERIHTALFA
jgi:CheY-like chemotaxis protein